MRAQQVLDEFFEAPTGWNGSVSEVGEALALRHFYQQFGFTAFGYYNSFIDKTSKALAEIVSPLDELSVKHVERMIAECELINAAIQEFKYFLAQRKRDELDSYPLAALLLLKQRGQALLHST
ncbi:hypothetical protein [Candidatus Burkholderia verschuerenii]|uniref:hypothetical protein n=1 Tax=Candidatus Burkholderia verschuerenii TaxID=242163 RepID=UPI000AD580AC|nr:hypothetical protein [Candidatus Burkholderia verschuerenii]